MSIYKTEYEKPRGEWEQVYSEFIEYAESCYLRWINADDDLSEDEVDLAVSYQEIIEADETDEDGLIEVDIPPEYDVSPEEFEVFLRIAHKLQKSGIGSIINAMLGNTGNIYLKGHDATWANTL
ncbi:hypothetical protein [Heyndrickxia ginsengihumi]|uniref:hypothetical protein n=1 Tax=Heyndrickxia ginsengihumi TaxID=363870 RepID=UPI003D1EA58F